MFVVYHKTSFKRVRTANGNESFANAAAAKAGLTRALIKSREQTDRDIARGYNNSHAMRREDYVVATYEAWAAAEPMVETYNMLDPQRRVVMIRASDKGGCTDPATETYHSM